MRHSSIHTGGLFFHGVKRIPGTNLESESILFHKRRKNGFYMDCQMGSPFFLIH